MIKSINALFVLSEGSVYASAELHRSSGKVIVTDFNKYITEVGSLDPLKEFAKGVKEFTTSQPTRESALKDLLKLQELLGNNDKNIRVVDSLIFAPMALIGGMTPPEEGLASRKQRVDISRTKHFPRKASIIELLHVCIKPRFTNREEDITMDIQRVLH